MVARIWSECRGVELERPFLRLTWEEADLRFGSDKPDLRFGLEIEEATDVTRGSGFKVFADAPAVRFLRVPRELSRGELAKLEEVAKQWGAKGLAYLVYGADGEVRSPIAKFLGEQELARFRSAPGETVIFAADEPAMVSRVLGALRLQLGRDLDLIDRDAWRFLWVTDFPMFEWDPELARWDAVHHPFTRPNAEGAALLDTDPGAAKAARLRPRRERRRASRRLLPDPRGRAAGEGLRPTEHLARGAAVEVRLPARRACDGCAAARRESHPASTGSR